MPGEIEDTLEVLTTYASVVEAGFAKELLEEVGIDARLDGEAVAANLSYFGTATGDCRVLVRKADLEEAARVLADNEESGEQDLLARGEEEGWWGEEPEEETPQEAGSGGIPVDFSSKLRRAYHAAILGIPFVPIGLVHLYSLYLVVRHRLFLPDRGGNDWRFYVAMMVSTVGLYFTKVFWTWY